MNKQSEQLRDVTRRHFFKQTGFGIGAMALSSLFNENVFAAPGSQRIQHFAPKAKRIIYLFMAGAPSSARPVRQQAGAPQIRRPALP